MTFVPKESEVVEFKVVETSIVTEDELTGVLNCWTRQGWTFDRFQFVVREASHRPSMAFAIFRRPAGGAPP